MGKVPKLTINGPIGEPDLALKLEGIETSVSADFVSKWLAENKSAKEIDVEIRSNGGSVTQGFMIHDLLINSGKKVNTYGYNVKSIATVIFLAGSTRKMAQNGEFLIHNPWIDPFSLGFEGITADKAQEIADDMRKEENRLIDFYSKKLGLDQTKASDLRLVMDRDSNMPLEDVLAWGFATEVMTEAAAKSKVEVYAYSDKVKSIIKAQSMAKNKDAKSAYDNIMSNLSNLGKTLNLFETVNGSQELEDGSTIYFDGELKVDSAVFSDAEMTQAAADKEYTDTNGRKITVSGGVVTAISEPTSSDAEQIAALKIANQRLINESKEKDKKIGTLEAENKTLKEAQATTRTQVEALTNQVKEFETKYFNEDPDEGKETGAQNFKGGNTISKSRYSGLKKQLTK